MANFIYLDDSQLLSSGSNRQCFFHPRDENLCVKVLHASSPQKTQNRELRYFNSLHRRPVSWHMVSRLVDVVPTNRGRGVVFELVRDFDGAVAKTLDHYLRLEDPFFNCLVVAKVEELKAYLYREAIIFRDLIALNVVLQRVDARTYKPVVVDGIGHNDFIPLCNYSTAMSRKKIVRTWNRKKHKWFDKYTAIRDGILAYPDHPALN